MAARSVTVGTLRRLPPQHVDSRRRSNVSNAQTPVVRLRLAERRISTGPLRNERVIGTVPDFVDLAARASPHGPLFPANRFCFFIDVTIRRPRERRLGAPLGEAAITFPTPPAIRTVHIGSFPIRSPYRHTVLKIACSWRMRRTSCWASALFFRTGACAVKSPRFRAQLSRSTPPERSSGLILW